MNRALIKKIALHLSKLFPFSILLHLSGQKFIFPFYHAVSDTPGPHIRHLYRVPSVSQFNQDLEFILRYFSPATFEEVLEFAHSAKQPQKPKFFLSFDDGLRECIDIIAPILNEKGIQAAFFINPLFTQNRILSHRQKISLILDALYSSEKRYAPVELNINLRYGPNHFGKMTRFIRNMGFNDLHVIDSLIKMMRIDISKTLEQKPYMKIEDIKALNSRGHIIGSHSMDHREFYSITENEMKNQLKQSFNLIEKLIEEKRKVFAFPFTDYGVPASFFRIMHEESIDLSFGTAGLKNDPMAMHLQRIPMEADHLTGAHEILRAEYSYYLAKSLFGRNTITRK